ncbi:FAD-dependent oxidoreductase [Candidatus Woesearchaeota archaeon]|nr:FAD-dependent oxidoreductase [Candidatus Woesearchaeota archaeon]
MSNIAVIGAGVFGITTALRLSQEHEVTLFEQHTDVMEEASFNNHWRHHIGYHYPRSKDTVQEIRNATVSFEKKYKKAIINGFPSYYGISKTNTKTTAEQFIKFCKEQKLPYTLCEPPKEIFDKDALSLCVKTPEAIYDMDAFKNILQTELSNSPIKLLLNHSVVAGKRNKTLTIMKGGKTFEKKFDVIINATYAHFNTFHTWFGFPKKEVQYELIELLEVQLPHKELFGATIVDGEFPSILPRGTRGTFTLGHVRASVLKGIISKEQDVSVMSNKKISSHRNQIIQESALYLPLLQKAKVLNSLFVTRVVKAHQEADDARPTEITEYGSNIYSIFAGKIITCVQTAEDLAKRIAKRNE